MPAHHAGALAETTLDEVHEAFPRGSIEGWHAAVSIGITVATPHHNDLRALLAAADSALEEAKGAGGDGYAPARPEPRSGSTQ